VRATSQDEVGELARAFNLMSEDLAAADQHRREIIANVSHELRTPISALRGVLENIVDGVAEPDPDLLRTALAQTERLGRLVAELLDLSSIDAGVHPLRTLRFELAPFIGEVLDEARVVSGGRVTFASIVEPPDADLIADRERLKQVMLNLLDNAARHSPPAGRVQVLAHATAETVVLEVRDEGPGIAPEERELVFERFTRGERAAGGGTGLGLAIARWVVNLHSGTIAVADDGTPGCRIRVALPRPA
jgi:signal transduction histidine kinase